MGCGLQLLITDRALGADVYPSFAQVQSSWEAIQAGSPREDPYFNWNLFDAIFSSIGGFSDRKMSFHSSLRLPPN